MHARANGHSRLRGRQTGVHASMTVHRMIDWNQRRASALPILVQSDLHYLRIDLLSLILALAHIETFHASLTDDCVHALDRSVVAEIFRRPFSAITRRGAIESVGQSRSLVKYFDCPAG